MMWWVTFQGASPDFADTFQIMEVTRRERRSTRRESKGCEAQEVFIPKGGLKIQ